MLYLSDLSRKLTFNELQLLLGNIQHISEGVECEARGVQKI